MCGIAGSLINNQLSNSKVSKILSLMKNRGPDNQSFNQFSFNKKKLYFFSSRLKIIDINDRSNQPMTFDEVTIIFNGEIYNHEELRTKIFKEGNKIKTKSDTEIIFISRDRFGEKPLYYYKKDGSFYFGSQTIFIRELISNNVINHSKILNYLSYGYKSIERDDASF